MISLNPVIRSGVGLMYCRFRSYRAPGLTSGLQGSVKVHRGVLLLVPKWQCISSFLFLHFCHTCSLCRVELVVQFPVMGSTQVLLCLFPGVLWLWHVLYSFGSYPVSSLHIYTFVVSRAFMATLTPPDTWSHLWFAGVRECPPWCSFVGATVTVYQFFCILHYWS